MLLILVDNLFVTTFSDLSSRANYVKLEVGGGREGSHKISFIVKHIFFSFCRTFVLCSSRNIKFLMFKQEAERAIFELLLCTIASDSHVF